MAEADSQELIMLDLADPSTNILVDVRTGAGATMFSDGTANTSLLALHFIDIDEKEHLAVVPVESPLGLALLSGSLTYSLRKYFED